MFFQTFKTAFPNLQTCVKKVNLCKPLKQFSNIGTKPPAMFQKIDETYGHIEVEKQVDILTQNQGIMRSADIDLTTETLD